MAETNDEVSSVLASIFRHYLSAPNATAPCDGCNRWFWLIPTAAAGRLPPLRLTSLPICTSQIRMVTDYIAILAQPFFFVGGALPTAPAHCPHELIKQDSQRLI